MLYEILKYIRNYFPDLSKQRDAKFTISSNVISPSIDVLTNQYFLIEGSALNDGVYKIGDDLVNETFTGTITPLLIPPAFLELVSEIEEYEAKNKVSAFVSESFGGYSYTKATSAKGSVISWRDAFGTRLNAWRKV